MRIRTRLQQVEEDLADLRENIRLQDSKSPVEIIWRKLRRLPLRSGHLVIFDVRYAILDAVDSGDISREEVIWFLGLTKSKEGDSNPDFETDSEEEGEEP